MELQSQLLAKQHCSKIMRGFSRWSNVVGNLNMTEFGARCIIFILFYVTGGHVVPESTVVRYIRQKLLSFMETTHTHIHTSPVFMLESCYDCQCEAKGYHKKQFFVACSQRTRLRWGRTAKGTAFSKYIRATTPHTETCKQLYILLRLGRPKEWSIGIFSRPPEAIWVHCPCPIMKPINVRIIPFIRHLNQLIPFLRRCVALPLVLPLFSRSSGTSK